MNRQGIAVAAALTAVTLPLAGYRVLTRRGGRRLLAAPRTMPGEEQLGPQIDAMGGGQEAILPIIERLSRTRDNREFLDTLTKR